MSVIMEEFTMSNSRGSKYFMMVQAEVLKVAPFTGQSFVFSVLIITIARFLCHTKREWMELLFCC